MTLKNVTLKIKTIIKHILMRKKIVAGNWKMNNDLVKTKALVADLLQSLSPKDVAIKIAPTFTNLYPTSEILKNNFIEVIAQNMHHEESGAFTGEISASMLKSIGVNTVILGHSERRAYFGENDKLLSKKVNLAIKNGMDIIFCIGEELEDRKTGKHFDVIKNQLKHALFHLDTHNWKHIVLAYEPVWAIGTGETATPEQAQEMHAFIRKTLKHKYNNILSEAVSILYGGSVKPENATEIFSQDDVDGGLIGGASLKASDFAAIVNAL